MGEWESLQEDDRACVLLYPLFDRHSRDTARDTISNDPVMRQPNKKKIEN